MRRRLVVLVAPSIFLFAALAASMSQVRAARDSAAAAGKSYVVRAVTSVHAEGETYITNPNYAANLAEWQGDYDTDVREITGQSERVVLTHSQISSWTAYGQTTSMIPEAQLQASVASGGATAGYRLYNWCVHFDEAVP